MKFGIGIPQVLAESRLERDGLDAFLRRAEELGYDGAWVLEQVIGVAPALEPIALLSYAAAATRSIPLGAAVIVTPLRIPVELATALATLDQLSGGRLIVGVALGGYTEQYRAFGLERERRVRRFTEGIELLKRLWTERSVTFEGEFWQLEEAAVEPKPIQRPHPPIWFGSGNPRGLRRAVELGDGWIGAGSSSTSEFRENARLVRSYLSEAGRAESGFPISKRVYIAVDDNHERTRGRLREWFALFYRCADLADRVAVFGSAERCAESLSEVADAGAGMIILNPVFDHLTQLEALAHEVIPKVRSTCEPHAAAPTEHARMRGRREGGSAPGE